MSVRSRTIAAGGACLLALVAQQVPAHAFAATHTRTVTPGTPNHERRTAAPTTDPGNRDYFGTGPEPRKAPADATFDVGEDEDSTWELDTNSKDGSVGFWVTPADGVKFRIKIPVGPDARHLVDEKDAAFLNIACEDQDWILGMHEQESDGSSGFTVAPAPSGRAIVWVRGINVNAVPGKAVITTTPMSDSGTAGPVRTITVTKKLP
ncbi:hypothetical protein [Streptomyces sp. SID3343]|uniref:hypothetical protein n=1 Tax=Streptomyces sp. SID3343 TaxID=2690260 RepID=UPI0013691BFD|nr:hypothetical protein [Streptomyces sp. SID3343]MYW04805.1 hypothetical protein [Streptomyces sp. SID3343]